MKRYKIYFTVEGARYHCHIVANSPKAAKALFALDYILDPNCWLHGKDVVNITARIEKVL